MRLNGTDWPFKIGREVDAFERMLERRDCIGRRRISIVKFFSRVRISVKKITRNILFKRSDWLLYNWAIAT